MSGPSDRREVLVFYLHICTLSLRQGDLTVWIGCVPFRSFSGTQVSNHT